MPDTLPIDHLRTWIGANETVEDYLAAATVARFQATLDGLVDSPVTTQAGIHWCVALAVTGSPQLGVDGHPSRGGFLPPVPLPRRMWASSKMEFLQPIAIDTSVTRTSTVTDVFQKDSATTGCLVFVTIDHEVQQEGAACVRETQTLVYRDTVKYEAAKARHKAPPKATATGEPFDIVAQNALLFRYSALTFNAHRIHYDQDYATNTEGYPALVVQGPLMATLLMHLAERSRPQETLSSFEFRGVAPAFANERLRLAATGRDTLVIWGADNRVIMQATAGFTQRPTAAATKKRRPLK